MSRYNYIFVPLAILGINIGLLVTVPYYVNKSDTPVAVVAPTIASSNTIPSTSSSKLPSSKEGNLFCDPDMVRVTGEYCSKVEQECEIWNPSDASTGDRAKFRRCNKFYPTKCIGSKTPMDYCIDKEEFAINWEGKPVSDISWAEARNICEANNKRLPNEAEWTFACEGEQMLPYTTGLERPTNLCHIDEEKNNVCGKGLCDKRMDIKLNPNCVSPFGVHNMAGNVDEFIEVPRYFHSKDPKLTMRSGLKGGHWLPVRNRCRPITKDHDEGFHQISIGFRCASDVKIK